MSLEAFAMYVVKVLCSEGVQVQCYPAMIWITLVFVV